MLSSATTHIPIPSLPPSATKSHGFNHLASGSLFSVGQACDHNFTAVFDKNYVKIFKSIEVNITAIFPPIIKGPCNAPSQHLYSVSIPTHPPPIYKANATINVSSIRDLIALYYGDLFSTSISTWCKAIKNYFLKSWTKLTVNQLIKYTPIYEATSKGHMYTQQLNISSTKKAPPNKNIDTTISTPSPIHSISKNKESYYVISRKNTVTDTLTPSSSSFLSS